MACCPTEAKYGYDDSRFEEAVDDHFHCSICSNVLKEPMMCRNNEHLFCRDCITEHLNTNSHTCPECNEDLTVETLRRARVVSNVLSGLKIKCDYSHRGCQEYIRLEELGSHVENCGFAPVKCSNEECEMIVNKLEIIYHESTVCEYRKVKCHNCVKIEQDVKEMKVKIEGMDEKMKEMKDKMEQKFDGVNKKIEGMTADVDEVKGLMLQMFDKLCFFENTIQTSSAINYATNTFVEDILVAGGFDNREKRLKSVEKFSSKNVWEKVSSMKFGHVGGTSFVYENQVFVAGGCDSRVIEVLNLNEDLPHWEMSGARLPFVCNRLRSIVYQNRVFLFCACGESRNYCAELCLTPPFTCKQLCNIPAPRRKNYTVVGFEDKVLIFGGENVQNVAANILEEVLELNLATKQFKVMPSLLSATKLMAGVRWGDQAILIGGFGENGPSKEVVMYDSKTGNITQLPSMSEERSASTAIITGNTIVVMGGLGQSGRVRSVEAFTLGGYSWKHLSAMNDIRSGATATVLPTKNTH